MVVVVVRRREGRAILLLVLGGDGGVALGPLGRRQRGPALLLGDGGEVAVGVRRMLRVERHGGVGAVHEAALALVARAAARLPRRRVGVGALALIQRERGERLPLASGAAACRRELFLPRAGAGVQRCKGGALREDNGVALGRLGVAIVCPSLRVGLATRVVRISPRAHERGGDRTRFKKQKAANPKKYLLRNSSFHQVRCD
mmetsp:Transcript_5611/g.14508  ORF Transcript_5611/g.14508 Transcript_5611/m.14508 type:complete len:202 (-) Transcript_5611:293-898(-)